MLGTAALCQELSSCRKLIAILGGAINVFVAGAAPASVFRDWSEYDVLLLDSRIAAAFAVCERVRNEEKPRILLVGAPKDETWGINALKAGAWGIVYRGARAREIVEAVSVVRHGRVWAPRHLIAAVLTIDLHASSSHDATAMLTQKLSMREQEVFCAAAAGLGNRQVADRLAISEATVKVHLTHIFQKLGLRSRAELAAAYHGIRPATTEIGATRDAAARLGV